MTLGDSVSDHLKTWFSEHKPEASNLIGAEGAGHLSDHQQRRLTL
jgi:hypothetical protein